MIDEPIKIDGNTVAATDWNPAQQELKNLILSSGQPLNAGDNTQTIKATSVYAGSGDYYTDSGAVNAYIATPISPKLAPPAYTNGLRVRFIAANVNTGASTLAIAGQSALPLKKGNISILSDLTANDISPNYLTEAIYISSLNCFILSPACYTQIVAVAQLPTATVCSMIYTKANTPIGWVIMEDGGVGDASSGATTRANADCQALFLAMWNNISDTYAPVYDSSGAKVDRSGVSALTDWNAHRRIKLLTSTGKVIANAGAQVLGYTTGFSTWGFPDASYNALHVHTYQLSASNSSGHTGINTLAQYNTTGDIFNTSYSGGSTAFSLMQPTLYLNLFIKL
jgi:hypothetical protein